jgi:hypothetical protein
LWVVKLVIINKVLTRFWVLVFGRLVLGAPDPRSLALVFGRFVPDLLAPGVLSSFLKWSAAALPTVAGELWLARYFKGISEKGSMWKIEDILLSGVEKQGNRPCVLRKEKRARAGS